VQLGDGDKLECKLENQREDGIKSASIEGMPHGSIQLGHVSMDMTRGMCLLVHLTKVSPIIIWN
jgi:hypothetical protein